MVTRLGVAGTHATVVVRFADGYASRTLRYQLSEGPVGWLVDNIVSRGSTFNNLLRVKKD